MLGNGSSPFTAFQPLAPTSLFPPLGLAAAGAAQSDVGPHPEALSRAERKLFLSDTFQSVFTECPEAAGPAAAAAARRPEKAELAVKTPLRYG